MANQWAIAIGINSYRSFQSLRFAQQDAEALCRHLIDSGITAAENCLLLTTASALHRGRSTFPERETIAQWLKGLVTGAMEPDDSLILFFSGYGIHSNGEDYLMPVDGNPAEPAATGIAVKSIYRLLAQVPSGKVLIALDMNRNAGSLGEPAGAYSARLGQQFSQQYPEIATLLSCQPPEQFARESAGLRHGFFTAGLLEVLRSRQREQPGETLNFQTFGSELSDRMAELCKHYFRPVQTPVVIGNYGVPLGQTAASALVSRGGGTTEAAGNESDGSTVIAGSTNWDWGNAIAVGESNTNGTTASNNGTPSNGNGQSNGNNVMNPLDISRPVDVSEGFGDDFANTWAWSLDGEPQSNATSNTGSSANGNGNVSATSSNGVSTQPDGNDQPYDPDLDPYAAAWEEDFGDTMPFDADSDVVRDAQAQLAQQQADLESDSSQALNQSSNGIPTQSQVVPARGGRPGHGGDGTDWHWADLSVAAATGDEPEDSLEDLTDDDLPDNIFEYPDRDSLNGFPEPGPIGNGQSNNHAASTGAGLAGAGLIIASRPIGNSGSSSNNGSSSQSGTLNPSQGFLDSEEDPNWNWNGDETAIDVEPQRDNGLGRDGDDPYYGDEDWPGGLELDDDDPEGLPIVELDSEEFVPDMGQQQQEGSSRPGWLSLRLLGALGVTALVAMGLLGFFRGNQGDGILPRLKNRLSLPVSLNLPKPWQGSDEPEDTNTGSNSRDLSNPDAAATGETSPGRTNINPAIGKDPRSNESSPKESVGASVSGSSNAESPDRPEPEFSEPDATVSNSGDSNSGSSIGSRNNSSDSDVPTIAGSSSAFLQQAQGRIEPGQASSFNRAIDMARQVPKDDPNHDNARQSMNQWSQEILTLSQQRAQGGEYLKAIATARLVPSDLAGFSEAQQSINQWQIPAQLEHAKAVTLPGQASSFNRAIAVARNVPEGNPSHIKAQQLMQGWGNDIFEIAQQRANQNQWGMAIAAAELVPPDMAAYGAAQAAIADWQQQLSKPK